MNSTTTRLDPTAQQFIERLAVALEFFGLSRIAGRILAYLIYFKGAASFDDLTEALQVSRGSVSTNTRQLEQMGVIERISRPGERVDYFGLTKDSQARFLEAWFGHVYDIEGIFQDTLAQLPDSKDETRQRIEYVDQFYRYVHQRMQECIGEWEARAQADHEAHRRRIGRRAS